MNNLWRAFKLVLPHKWMLFWYALTAIVLAVVSSAPLVLVKTFLDKLQGKDVPKDKIATFMDAQLTPYFPELKDYIIALCVMILVLWTIKAVMDFFNSYLSSWLAQRLRMEAMENVMRKLLALDIPYFDSQKTGDLVTRMVSDGENLRKTVKIFLDFLRQPPQIAALMAVAIYYDWLLFTIGLVGVPLIFLPIKAVIGNISKQTKKYQQKTAGLAQAMIQNLEGIRIIFAYDAAKQETKNFGGLTESLFRTGLRRNFSRALQRPMVELVLGIGLAGVLLVGGLRAINNPTYNINDFVAFVAALGMVFGPLRALMGTTVELAELLPSAERTFEVLDLKPTIGENPDAKPCPALKEAITFENLSFDYGRGTVFSGLNLTVRAGEKIGIVGKTGVGKSTLLSLLMRFYDPTKGRILIDGVDIKGATLSSLRSQIAFVNQRPFLFHATVMENIRYGRMDATDEEVIEAAKMAMVHDEIMAQPEGYETLCGERGGELFSGGQGQRICVARAILRRAPILLLDEATSALDTFSERRVQEALDKLVENCTSIIVAHRLSTLRNVNRIMVFAKTGGIEAIAPHEELLRISPTYRELWNEQNGGAPVTGVEQIS